MGKLITVESKNVLCIREKVLPFLEKYYDDNGATFYTSPGDIMLVAYVSEKTDLVKQLDNIRNARNVIIDIVNDGKPNTDPTDLSGPLRAAKHITHQINSLVEHRRKFNIIVHSKHIPLPTTFFADMALEFDNNDLVIRRVVQGYFNTYMGNELTDAAKEVIVGEIAMLDVDGDIFKGNYYNSSTRTYPKGTHPFLIMGDSPLVKIHVPDGDKHISETDIKAIDGGDEATYCRLADEYMRIHPEWAARAYVNMPITVRVDKGIGVLNKEYLEGFSPISEIAKLGDGLYSFDEVLHPYTLFLFVYKMTEHQSVVVEDKEYSKLSLELLLQYSPHFFNSQLERFIASLPTDVKGMWEKCYQ